MMKYRTAVELNPADMIAEMGRMEAIELIKAIDAAAHDWDFTLELCDHFARLNEEWRRETEKYAIP